MHSLKFHEYRLFSNLDPLEVGYEDQLRQGGRVVATLHTEYAITGLAHKGNALEIILKKDWTDGTGQPLGGVLVLRFENAAVTASPVNEPGDTFEKSAAIRDLRPYKADEAEQAAGRALAVEIATDQGLWDVVFASATVSFDPPVGPEASAAQ
jgi:hypothetical protein